MPRKILHIISQAHLDPVWLWRWRDGAAEALTTMQSALDRMDETPGFCFSRSSAITYRWARDLDPRLFEGIRARVADGRWEVVGGWIEQPDCNVPSAESFVRQALYGKRWLKQALGVEVKTGYNVDSFGHAAGLPQLLARAGYENYVFMRPQAHEMALPTLFWWAGPDGSRVLTWRIPMSYCQGPTTSDEEIGNLIRRAAEVCFVPGVDDGAFFLGVGNHGGGPTRRHLAALEALRGEDGLPELRYSTLEAFFAAVRRSPAAAELPVIRGELQHHARGCYAAHGEMKAANRRAEQSLFRAESLSALAHGVLGEAQSPEPLEPAWWALLFNQFHDILAGTSIAPAYRDTFDEVGGACAAADRATVRAVSALSRALDTSAAPGGVLCLANPLPWRRRAVVRVELSTRPNAGDAVTHLAEAGGTKVPIQYTEAASVFGPHGVPWRTLTAVVELPPGGYRAYHLATGEPPADEPWTPVAETGDGFGVASLKLADGRETLAGSLGLVVLADESDTWSHGVASFREEVGRPELVRSEVVADGPVCRTVRQRAVWNRSEIRCDVTTWRELGVVELKLRVNWQEQRRILKLEVPTRLIGVTAVAAVPGAVVRRGAGGDEEPCGEWVALSGELDGAEAAVALLNAGSYSYDALDGLLRMEVVRGVPFAEHDPHRLPEETETPFLDQGWQERTFWLAAGPSVDALALHRLAAELQHPAEYFLDSIHAGTQPWEQAGLEVGPAQVAVLAVKPAEDDEGVIVRLQAMSDAPVTTTLTAGGQSHAVNLGAWELATVRLSRAGLARTDLLER